MKTKEKQKERTAEKIVVHYDDGTVDEMTQGFLAFMGAPENGEIAVEFKFVKISGGQVEFIVRSVMMLGKQLGMFDRRSAR